MTTTHLVAIPALLLVIAALWPIALFVALAAAVAYLHESRRRDRLRVVGLELELAAYEFAAAKKNADALAQIVSPLHRAGKGTQPHLYAVPEQRTPESAEVSDYSWPETARQIQHDEWTRLMRAVEED